MPPKREGLSQTPGSSGQPEQARRLAMVHILSPDFQGLDPASFADIAPEVVARTPETMRKMLIGVDRDSHEAAAYHPGEQRGHKLEYLALTIDDFLAISQSPGRLASSVHSRVLKAADVRLQTETGKPGAKARTDEDLAKASRGPIRALKTKHAIIAEHLETEIEPRIAVIELFKERIKHRNLLTGTAASIRADFEYLRTFVFGDMLDAIGNNQGWDEATRERAARIVQKMLYVEGSAATRCQSFFSMVKLAEDYYGAKRAMANEKMAEAEHYFNRNQGAYANVEEVDAERAATAGEE